MKKLLFFILFSLCAFAQTTVNGGRTYLGEQDMHSGSWRAPEKTVSTLPSAASSTGLIFMVTDGTSSSDCTTGGSTSFVNACRSNGSAWVFIGGSGGGGGISGLTTNVIPKATGSTSIGNSSITDNGTTVSTTEPIAAPSIMIGSSPPTSSVCTNATSGQAGMICANEGTTPTGTLLSVGVLWPNTSTSRWDMIVNNGSNLQIAAAGVDINTSDQVTGLNGASIPTSAGVLGTNSSGQAVKSTQTNLNALGYAAGGGSSNAQTVTLAPAIASYTTGLTVSWTPTAANTSTTPTLAVNGLSAVTIVKAGGALAANDIITTAIATAKYDGTHFELQNPQTASGGGSSTVTVDQVFVPFINNTGGGNQVMCDADGTSPSAGIQLAWTMAQGDTTKCAIDIFLPTTYVSGSLKCEVFYDGPNSSNTGSGSFVLNENTVLVGVGAQMGSLSYTSNTATIGAPGYTFTLASTGLNTLTLPSSPAGNPVRIEFSRVSGGTADVVGLARFHIQFQHN